MEVHITTCARAKTRNSSKAGVVPACGDCTASWLLAGRLPPPISLSHNCFTSVCSHTGALFQIFFLDIRYIFFSSSRFVCVFLHQYTIFFVLMVHKKYYQQSKSWPKSSELVFLQRENVFFTGCVVKKKLAGGSPVRKWGNSRLDFWLDDHCTEAHHCTMCTAHAHATKQLNVPYHFSQCTIFFFDGTQYFNSIAGSQQRTWYTVWIYSMTYKCIEFTWHMWPLIGNKVLS